MPVEPEVLVAGRAVELVIELLHHSDDVAVEGPEAELRHLVALLFHGLHRAHEHFPFVPVQDGIGDIQDNHVHTGIHQHRHVAPYHPFVLTQEIAGFGFSPMVGAHAGACGPSLIGAAGIGVLCQYFGHIGQIGLSVVQPRCMPGDVEDSHGACLVRLQRAFRTGGHGAPHSVGCHPRVGHQVLIVARVCMLGLCLAGKESCHSKREDGLFHYYNVLMYNALFFFWGGV